MCSNCFRTRLSYTAEQENTEKFILWGYEHAFLSQYDQNHSPPSDVTKIIAQSTSLFIRALNFEPPLFSLYERRVKTPIPLIQLSILLFVSLMVDRMGVTCQLLPTSLMKALYGQFLAAGAWRCAWACWRCGCAARAPRGRCPASLATRWGRRVPRRAWTTSDSAGASRAISTPCKTTLSY